MMSVFSFDEDKLQDNLFNANNLCCHYWCFLPILLLFNKIYFVNYWDKTGEISKLEFRVQKSRGVAA